MTVVAAYARDGVVAMAADTAAGSEDRQVLGVRKIRRIRCGTEPALLSCEGFGGIACFLAREWDPGTPPLDDDLDGWQAWADNAASHAGALLHNADLPLTATSNDGLTCHDASLLAVAGRLIYIYTHQAVVIPHGPAALGSGADLAIGFLHGTDTSDPKAAVGGAVELACRYIAGCSVEADGPQVEVLSRASGDDQ